MTVTIALSSEQLDAIADAVAARLQPTPTGLVDARAVANALGISADTVRAHAERLGGQRIGEGKRPRWRFDLEAAIGAWTYRPVGSASLEPISQATRAIPRRRQASGKGSGRRLLPIHGVDDAVKAR